jgi:hypothetical protein
MRIAAALVSILLLSVLLFGCPNSDSALERSRKPGNVLTTPTEEGTTDYGSPPAGGTTPPARDSGGSESSGGSSDDEDNRSAGNDEDGE